MVPGRQVAGARQGIREVWVWEPCLGANWEQCLGATWEQRLVVKWERCLGPNWEHADMCVAVCAVVATPQQVGMGVPARTHEFDRDLLAGALLPAIQEIGILDVHSSCLGNIWTHCLTLCPMYSSIRKLPDILTWEARATPRSQSVPRQFVANAAEVAQVELYARPRKAGTTPVPATG